ncbi:hypothetical protein [Pseudomonas aeruginosa]|uniref:hypothetical protein n=1 Tax=Pseudomonas aeruginosa TaxID=287 RepID=UPI001ADD1685|nr:hypothetical protein [Pseudomonas aeruginosa]MBO8337094.1 hypothetical protein [Pseudomonas aeruginosa]
MIDQVVHKLHLWTDGDSNSGRTGETAEVSAPGWLLSSEAYDPEEFMVVLEAFREKAREAFEVIWPNEIGRRQKLSATPDLSGTVLPLCHIPNSALKNAPPSKSATPRASACAGLLA